MSLKRSSLMRDNLSTNYLLFALGGLTILLIHGSLGQDILFPGERPPITQRVQVNTTTVRPSSTVCPANMTAVREDNETEDFCECTVGNLYHAKLDRCFLQYTRGPCDKGEFFILQKNSTIAKCVRNPCTKPDTVPFRGSCYGLYLPGGPCKSNETLAVPETSYGPECVEIVPVHYQIITAPRKMCGPGTRRAGYGKCRMILP